MHLKNHAAVILDIYRSHYYSSLLLLYISTTLVRVYICNLRVANTKAMIPFYNNSN